MKQMSQRREYNISIQVNERAITKLIIDPHYELKHGENISDELILELVSLLDKGIFPSSGVDGAFTYFATDGLSLRGKKYKLIWLLEDDQLYIGVVNAYRR